MKKLKNTFFFILAFSGIIYFSCNENAAGGNLEVEKGVNYYPLEVGNSIIYQLDSIVYFSQSGNPCAFTDTSSHFLREEVVDVFEDNEGELNYIIERYTSQNQSGPWQVTDVWNTKKTDTQVERVEENLRFIKMVFPVTDGATWNGNTFFQDTTIQLGGQAIDFYKHWSSQYEYGMIDVAEEFNGLQFDSVMTVVQSEPSENKVNHRSSIEKYARGVGLIFKEMLILDTQCCGNNLGECDGVPWDEKAERGLILRQSVVSY